MEETRRWVGHKPTGPEYLTLQGWGLAPLRRKFFPQKRSAGILPAVPGASRPRHGGGGTPPPQPPGRRRYKMRPIRRRDLLLCGGKLVGLPLAGIHEPHSRGSRRRQLPA